MRTRLKASRSASKGRSESVIATLTPAKFIVGQIDVDEGYELKVGMTLVPTWAPVRVQYGENVFGLKLEPLL